MSWILVALLAALPAARCRYTVRDVGFVDLAGPTYELALIAPATHALTAADRARLDGLAAGCRVAWQRREPSAAHGSGWELRRAELAPLGVGALASEVDEVAGVVESSRLRDALLSEALTSFALVLFVESGDERADARARAALAAALEQFPEVARGLPRPVQRPLRRLTLSVTERDDERVLLWSLGLSSTASAPAVAVLFGRGQLAGEPLVGDAIEAAAVLARLALVGESCECEADPFLHVRPAVPLAWSERHRQRAAEELGFDPESPFVKAEIATILTRAADAGGRLELGVGLGYRETVLSPGSELAPLADPEPAAERAPAVIAAGAGDWSFADEQQPEEAPDPTILPLLATLGTLAALSLVGAAVLIARRRAR